MRVLAWVSDPIQGSSLNLTVGHRDREVGGKESMTLDELRKEGFFHQLSEGQQKFVIERCSGKKNIEAAKAAWNCESDASANTMANRAMKNANVKWLINKFLGIGAAKRVPTAEELAAWNWEKAQSVNIPPELAIKFAQNVAKIMGYESKPVEKTPESPDDGDEEFNL
jgi:hypothetical protein